MRRTSKIQKTLIAFILMIIAICTKSSVSLGASVWFSGWKAGSNPLWNSHSYYCLEHQDGFNGGTWNSYKTQTIRSDDSSQANRALAYILYQGIKTGNGGYNGRGTYQYAVWRWYYMHSGMNKINVSSSLYETAMKQKSIPYSSANTAAIKGKSITISGTNGSAPVDGTAQLSKLTGTVSKIKVTWKNTANDKTYTKTVKAGKSSVNGWIEFYSNSSHKKSLNVDKIGTDKFYFVNKKTNYQIQNIKIYTKTKASGYQVTLTYYTKANGDTSEQDLLSASYVEGKATEASTTLKLTYPEMTEYTVNKIWEDNNDSDGKRADYEVTLTGKVDKKAVYTNTVKLSKDKTSYTWKNLYKYSNKKKIVYSVEETKVPEGYTKVVSGNTITNKYSPDFTEFTVNKIWDDNNDSDGKRADYEVTLTGKVDGKVVYTNTVKLSKDKTSYTWKKLERNKDGKEIIYSVDETKVPEGYTKVVSGNTITNTHTPPPGDEDPEYTSYTVRKIWEDANNVDDMRSNYEVTLVGRANGEIVYKDTVTLSPNQTTYTWKNLDKYLKKDNDDEAQNTTTNNTTVENSTEIEKTEIVYSVDETSLPEGYIKEVSGSTITNKQKITIEGFVWEDIPGTKGNEYNHIYDGNSDKLLSGITVRLCKGSDNNILAETTTDSDGHYTFTKKKDGTYIVRNDIENAYVMFIYDNTKYVTVNPSDEENGSKAQESTVTAEKLDDRKLTGTTGAVPGEAVTRGEFTTNKGKVENINLGLIEKHDPNYSIVEELDSIRVELNGYTYTYKYGAENRTDGEKQYFVPTTSIQTLTGFYTAQIYPSDIAYNVDKGGDKLKVYAVYNITVKNDETTNIDSVYKEQRLYLNSLTNRFDAKRYELNDSKWEKTAEGIASYKELSSSNFAEGIEAQAAKSTTIEFKMKDDALNAILNQDLSEYSEESVPTVTIANAYHEYLREDNIWDSNPSVKSYRNGADVPDGFLHRSVDKQASSYALYIHMKLGEARIISGTVFEDAPLDPSRNKMGNGIYDSDENITGQTKVELLNIDKTTVTDLYQYNNKNYQVNKATTYTGNDGKYSFEGVVPGVYYIRFTYGNGEQKVYAPDGKEVTDVTIDKYEATRINEKIGLSFETANNLSASDIQNVQNTLLGNSSEDAKKSARAKIEWYKYLDSAYSVAMDDSQDNGFMNAYTPGFSISIENDQKDEAQVGKQKNVYGRFNFGIIKKLYDGITIEKKITNVSAISQEGNTILSENPQGSKDTRLVSLDPDTVGGSKYAKLEIDPNILYGGRLVLTYTITINNTSKYNSTVQEVKDDIDKKYKIDYEEKKFDSDKGKIKVTAVNSNSDDKYLTLTGWSNLAPGESETVSYTVMASINPTDEDLLYTNSATIMKLYLQKNETGTELEIKESTDIKYNNDSTEFSMIPPTGEDKDVLYWVVGTIALVVVSTGIVVIKKQVI